MKRQTHFTLGLESESILLKDEETIFSTLKLLSKLAATNSKPLLDAQWKEWVDSYGGKA
jgi:hypothetical protein